LAFVPSWVAPFAWRTGEGRSTPVSGPAYQPGRFRLGATSRLSHRKKDRSNAIGAGGLTAPSYYFWTAAWLVPQDYPTGSLSYRVVATDMQGNTQEWTPMKDLRSLPVVMPGEVEYTK